MILEVSTISEQYSRPTFPRQRNPIRSYRFTLNEKVCLLKVLNHFLPSRFDLELQDIAIPSKISIPRSANKIGRVWFIQNRALISFRRRRGFPLQPLRCQACLLAFDRQLQVEEKLGWPLRYRLETALLRQFFASGHSTRHELF